MGVILGVLRGLSGAGTDAGTFVIPGVWILIAVTFLVTGMGAACGEETGGCALPEGFILVAHRGVVDDQRTENSLAALDETIRRGYTHIEVDLQCTKDGHVVCCHNRSLRKVAGVAANVDEITLAELRALVSEEKVPSFATFCERCEGRIDLMPDIKAMPAHLHDAFIEGAERAMVRHGLLDKALFIGETDLAKRFSGKTRVCWRAPLGRAAEMDPGEGKPRERYFVFNHAVDFTKDVVDGFRAMGLEVIVSINTLHYFQGDRIEQGLADVRRMLELGVDGLQIDSVYDTILELPGSR